MVSAPLLSLTGVTKVFPNGTAALKCVDLTLEKGRVHGLLGANGAGKSTLIKILSGAQPATDGTIRWKGDTVSWKRPRDPKTAGVATIYQHIPLVSTLSALENILLDHEGFWRHKPADRQAVAAVVDSLGSPFKLDDLVSDLPIGARQMVAISAALLSGAELVIMDEPTASLAGHERQAVYALIRRLARDEGKAVLFVSHFINEIIDLTDDVTVLRDGRVALEARTADLNETLIAEAIAGRAVAHLQRDDGARKTGAIRLSVRDIASAGRLKPVSFDVRAGEIIGIAGMLSSGRSELLHAIFGADDAATGTVHLDDMLIGRSAEEAVAAGLALVPEDRAAQGYVAQLPLWQNVSLPHLSHYAQAGILPRIADEQALAQTVVERIQIKTSGIDAAVTGLSGGNAQKVVIGKWLTPYTRCLLLDEPTAGIDIGARTDILRLVRQMADDGLPVVLVSSEFEELLTVCDRILVMRDCAVVVERTAASLTLPELILLSGGTLPATVTGVAS
jgi:ribose transport system ATP-binding protein